ncbi:MAG: glycosyltransferase family 2 protein [Frankiaceae bacterium]
MSDAPLVTVVVPARNEERSIARCLDSVLGQTGPDLEVLVVDGDSDDATLDVVRERAARDPRVRVLRNPRRVIPAALNVGLAAARGRWLVRVDAHSTVPPHYVETVVGHLATGRWGGVGGRKDAVSATTVGRAVAAALGSPFGVGNSHYHHATEAREVDHVPFGAYPVALCRAVGGWDEAITTNEDYEFDYRVRLAGGRLLLDPSLRIAWECRETLPALAGQYWRYGKGKAAVARKHPRSLRPRHLAAPLLVAAAVAAAATAAAAPRRPGLPALGALATAYGGVLALGTAHASRTLTDRRARRWLPAALATMHLAWGAGFWAGLLTGAGRQREDQPGEEAQQRGEPVLVQDRLDHPLGEEADQHGPGHRG